MGSIRRCSLGGACVFVLLSLGFSRFRLWLIILTVPRLREVSLDLQLLFGYLGSPWLLVFSFSAHLGCSTCRRSQICLFSFQGDYSFSCLILPFRTLLIPFIDTLKFCCVHALIMALQLHFISERAVMQPYQTGSILGSISSATNNFIITHEYLDIASTCSDSTYCSTTCGGRSGTSNLLPQILNNLPYSSLLVTSLPQFKIRVMGVGGNLISISLDKKKWQQYGKGLNLNCILQRSTKN